MIIHDYILPRAKYMAEPPKHRFGMRGLYKKSTPKEKNLPFGTIPNSYSLEDVGQRLPSLKLTGKFAAEK